MHRDLRADNVLINVVENESYISPSVQVKLTDFGMSKLNLNNSRFTTMERGNAHWRAPEIFQDEQKTEKYTNAADVCIALHWFSLRSSPVRCHLPTKISDSWKDLLWGEANFTTG